ncbi:MAG: hypothetical protein WCW52_02685 [Elusimicrobiales bacterium]|jgi:hypothetical protein
MKSVVITAAISFLTTGAYAVELNLNSTEFNGPALSGIKTAEPSLPMPAFFAGDGKNSDEKGGHVTGEITGLHLLAQSEKSRLFTHADTESKFSEFVNLWTPILERFNLRPAGTEYKDAFGALSYESDNGLVVRDFFAEQLRYDALNPEEINELQRELLEPLQKAGMTPVAAFTVKHEAFRPTFKLYYLTKPDETPAHEIRLRQLKAGEDIDFDIVTDSVRIVKKDSSYSLVYIGKELGAKTKWSDTEEGARTKLEEYKKFLRENGKEFIGARIIKLDEPFVSGELTINYIVNMYFFQ